MWSSKLHDRQDWRTHLAETDARNYQLWLSVVLFLVLGTLTFNFFLAVANTHVLHVSDTHVILAEMALLAIGMLLALSRSALLYVILALYLSYMALILALRPELDLKAIRDFLIPIVFYFIGLKIRRIEDADRLVWISAILVTIVGLFEFAFIDVYMQFVDIFQYYVDRGSLAADANFVEGSNLFISSTRYAGRNFFGFLPAIRASSVFLEPVTMGNFGAFLCLWALYRQGMQRRAAMFFLAFVVIVLSDARFGMAVCIAFIPVVLLYRMIPRIVWWLLPFLFMLALTLYGGWTSELRWEDDFPGRILHSAQIADKATLQSLFGIALDLPFVADNGFAYSVTQVGIIGLTALWTLFIFARTESERAFLFKALSTAFICLMMIVSNSLYSIKFAALFWILAGAVDVAPMASSQLGPAFVGRPRNRAGAV